MPPKAVDAKLDVNTDVFEKIMQRIKVSNENGNKVVFMVCLYVFSIKNMLDIDTLDNNS